jgi:hypothetical protein
MWRRRPLDTTKTRYKATWNPETGAAVYIHRLRAEKALGHPLPKRAEVHHADGSNDETAQLVICPNRAYHHFLHRRMEVKAAGGNPQTDKFCGHCRKAKPFSEFYKRRSSPTGLYEHCKECVSEYQACQYKKKATRQK